MSSTSSLIAILAAIAVGAISPGPSFILVSRIAISSSRRNGLSAALGMGLGGALFSTLALAGLVALLSEVTALDLALRLAGGAYLLYLAWRIWRGASQPLETGLVTANAPTPRRSFASGFLTQISNPKTAVVYAGIFAALLPAAPPLWMTLALPPLIFLVEAGWYAAVALATSAGGPRRVYLRVKTGLDRTAASVLGFIAIRLIIDGLRSSRL